MDHCRQVSTSHLIRVEAVTLYSYLRNSACLTWKNKANSIKRVRVNFFQQRWIYPGSGFPQKPCPPASTHTICGPQCPQDAPGLAVLAGPGCPAVEMCRWHGPSQGQEEMLRFVLTSEGHEPGSSPQCWRHHGGDTVTFTLVVVGR